MNYDFAVISNVSKELHDFLSNPTQEKNITLLFHPPPDNQTIYMCLIKRRYEGFLKSEYFDLYLQLGGFLLLFPFRSRVNTYLLTARRKECGIRTTLKLSIPYELDNAEPLHGKTMGLDRLPIGMIRSNTFNTSYYACVNPELISYLKESQLIDNNEVHTITPFQ